MQSEKFPRKTNNALVQTKLCTKILPRKLKCVRGGTQSKRFQTVKAKLFPCVRYRMFLKLKFRKNELGKQQIIILSSPRQMIYKFVDKLNGI